jgi:hypothetical protein
MVHMGRRPVPTKDKKLPTDYPQMAFRVTVEDKKRLTSAIERVQDSLNARCKEGDPYVNKNDVIIRALFEGLKKIG